MITDERRVLLFQLLFLGTGVISTIGAQWVKYRGAANSISFVTSLCQFMGMILVAALPPPKTLLAKPRTLTVQPSGSFLDRIKSHLSLYGPVSIKGAALLSTLEVSGNLINVAGMFLTGSGLYMVIYSSIVVFTAMFSKLLLPSSRQLNTTQWISVFAICFGLAITAIESSGHHDKSGEAVLLGIVICLVGTGLHSLVYVGTDHLLATEASTPYSQSIYVGMFSTLFTLGIMLFISIPTLLTLPLFAPDVIIAHMILILSSLGHSLAYFELVEATGGVATGVLQGLRAVLVFGISGMWFCGRDSGQCFTFSKGIATIVVVCGVVAFSAAKGSGAKEKKDGLLDSALTAEDEEIGMEDMTEVAKAGK